MAPCLCLWLKYCLKHLKSHWLKTPQFTEKSHVAVVVADIAILPPSVTCCEQRMKLVEKVVRLCAVLLFSCCDVQGKTADQKADTTSKTSMITIGTVHTWKIATGESEQLEMFEPVLIPDHFSAPGPQTQCLQVQIPSPETFRKKIQWYPRDLNRQIRNPKQVGPG